MKMQRLLGLIIEADIIQRARKMLFAPKVIAEERKPRKKSTRRAAPANRSRQRCLVSSAPKVLPHHPANSATFAFLRSMLMIRKHSLTSSSVWPELLPQEGLIVDVRGNGGGHIHASEGLLQVLTPVEITPEPTQFINTPLNARICESA